MDKKYFFMILIIIALVIILGVMVKFAIPSDSQNNDFNSNFENLGFETDEDDDETVEIIETSADLKDSDISSKVYSDFDANIDLTNLSSTGEGVEISDTTIKITKAGTYYFSGKLDDGNIVVEATKDDEVVLVFGNAEITSSKTSVINVVKAKNVTINLVEGSTNVFTDGSEYTEFTDDDEPDSTIFSKSDLYITGTGSLKINANYEDAIASKDTLAIVDCNIEVVANDDGIRGKDFVSIKNAKITIDSKNDGIKSTNDDDESLGYVIIDSADINITSEEDGIQAETVVNSTNSNITIKTTGEIASKTNNMKDFKNSATTSDEESDSSSKGIKAGKEITINSGKINITSTDDSLHSSGYIIINDGELEISSGDDGIHSDNNILINGGNINITKSYEGIESKYIKINDGNISVVASDDGINVSGGSEFGGMGQMGGDNSGGIVGDSDRQLIINGGTIYVNSQGDGLDSNGSIVMNGGKVTVAGTESNGNAALDYDRIFNVNGGTLIAYGATGMWQTPSTSSNQYSICFGVSGNKRDIIVLKDSNGNEIVNFTTENSYGAVTISNEGLKKGETYRLYVNGEEKDSKELTSIVTSNLSNSGGMQGQGGMRKGQ